MGVDDRRTLRPAVLLDRDGVLNDTVLDARHGEHPESPLDPADVRIRPGAAEAVVALRAAGLVVVVVSNQPAAAKETIDLATLAAVHQAVAAVVEADAWRYCLHHPEGTAPDLGGACLCRKPRPGLLLAASVELGLDLGRSWMVGDTDADVAAGRAAGCRTILVDYAGSAHRRSGDASPDHTVADLPAAAQLILRSTV